jgi:hypothetical protein
MKIPNNHGFLSTHIHIHTHTNKHRNINLEHILDIASFFLICDTQNISNKARHGLFEASNYIYFLEVDIFRYIQYDFKHVEATTNCGGLWLQKYVVVRSSGHLKSY